MSATEVSTLDESRDRRLWNEHRETVANAVLGEILDFSGKEFSEDPADQYFREVEFSEIADFTGSIFQTGNVFEKAIFHRDAIFNNATFKAKSDFPDVIFEEKVSFDEAVFSEAVGFHSNFQGNVSFEGAIFQSDALFGHRTDLFFKDLGRLKYDSSLSFDNAEFRNAASFDNLDFDGNVSFKSARFFYWSEFIGLEFKDQVSFEDAHFLRCTDSRDKRRNLVRFQEVKFDEKATFTNCQFDCIAKFIKNDFKDQAEFRKAEFNEEVMIERTNRFHDRLFLDKSYKSFSRPEDAIVPYRFAKQTAHHAGDSRMEGNYHFQEQCSANKTELKSITWEYVKKHPWKGLGRLIAACFELVIGNGIYGYGEKTHRILVAAMVVILFCSGLFFVFEGINYGSLPVDNLTTVGAKNYAFEAVEYPTVECRLEDGMSRDWRYAGNCLYFSVVTFTTLGYGDFQPYPGMRWLSATEAALGAALMAMFIVSLSRKFVR